MSRAEAVIDSLSKERPIEFVRRFEHGAGGTSLARLDGQLVVVKAWPSSPSRERTITLGLRCAERAMARSVPIPRLIERGSIGPYSFLLYEFVSGEWPPQITSDLARQLFDLLDRHRDAADQPDPSWRTRMATMITDGDVWFDITPQNLRTHPEGREILHAADSALRTCDPEHVRTTDIVHGDYAPENLLVHNGTIKAVIDWEQACTGDVGFDLAGTVFDIEIGDKADPDTLDAIYAAVAERVPPDAWRLYTHLYAVRYASWAVNTEMEAEVLKTIARITSRP